MGGRRHRSTPPSKPTAMIATPTPAPLREPRHAIRADLERDVTGRGQRPEAGRRRRRDFHPPATGGGCPAPRKARPRRSRCLVIDDLVVEPAVEPVIGPELAGPRHAARLTVDQLADRTRIRPHVIESIEMDDFVPCGGDFYARGHLRTLARVLGGRRGAAAGDVRRDSTPTPRSTRAGSSRPSSHRPARPDPRHPRWPELVGDRRRGDDRRARVVDRPAGDGQPRPVSPSSPSLADGSAGLTTRRPASAAEPCPSCSPPPAAARTSSSATAAGKVRLRGQLAFGQSATLQVSPPVRIQYHRRIARGQRGRPGPRRTRRTGQPARTSTSSAESGRRRVRFGAELDRRKAYSGRGAITTDQSAVLRRPADPWLCSQRGRLRGARRTAGCRRVPAGRGPGRRRHRVVNTCGFVEQAKKDSVDALLEAADLKGGRTAAGRRGGGLPGRAVRRRAGRVAAGGRRRARLRRLPRHRRPAAVDRGGGAAPPAHARRPAPAAADLPGRPARPAGREGAGGAAGPTGVRRRWRRSSWPAAATAAAPSARSRLPRLVRQPSAHRRPGEARWLAAEGVRELFLVTENSTSYGKDLGDLRLLETLLPELVGRRRRRAGPGLLPAARRDAPRAARDDRDHARRRAVLRPVLPARQQPRCSGGCAVSATPRASWACSTGSARSRRRPASGPT